MYQDPHSNDETMAYSAPSIPDLPTVQQPVEKKKITYANAPMWVKILAPVVGIMVFCAVCGMCSFAIGAVSNALGGGTTANAPTHTTTTKQQVVPPTAAPPTATTMPTVDPEIARYRNFVVMQTTTLGTDFTDVGSKCSNGSDGSSPDLTACRAALQTAHGDIVTFQQGMGQYPAPACMHNVDVALRTALNDYEQGTQMAIDGIDNYDAGKIQQGATLMDDGTSQLQTATGAVETAVC